MTGNIAGNLSGSVGSVGGNVAGSVGSVTAAVVLPVGTGPGQINLSAGAVVLQANQAVNATQIGGQAVSLDSNNLLMVDMAGWGGTPVSLSGGLPSVNAANVNTGEGPIAINQNTGGTDNLRYVDSNGNGVEGASVLIYRSTDWPSQPNCVQATAITGPDGRWLSPAFVQSGTYVAVFTKLGADGPDVSPPFSV
jgi:hypothetical protein